MRSSGASLRLIAEQPTVRADESSIDVSAALSSLLPGGLQRGITTRVVGDAARSLLFALVAAPTQAGMWIAVIGVDDLGLGATRGLGVALERMVFVEQPPRSKLGQAIGACIGSFDCVVVQSVGGSLHGARRLRARARERGTVLMQLGGEGSMWGERADVELVASTNRWEGLGVGHGHLVSRHVEVTITGRRGASRPRSTALWLPDDHGEVRAFEETGHQVEHEVEHRVEHGVA